MEKIRRKGAKLLRQCSQMTLKGSILKKMHENIVSMRHAKTCTMQNSDTVGQKSKKNVPQSLSN